MPESVLVLGSGPIQIGQAGEFDYAGAQALKALKERGFRTLLLNSNLASAQTLGVFADRVFALPLTPASVQAILASETPIGVLAGFGGQSALNLALELDQAGLLKRLPLLGTALETLMICEDRLKFFRFCQNLGLPVPKTYVLSDLSAFNSELNATDAFPLLQRKSFALGGQGAVFYPNLAALWADPGLKDRLNPAALLNAPLLLEEDLRGWQEIEFEVLADAAGNQLVVCATENIDPMGIHTGDSYVVTPPMTLSDASYFGLRAAALKLVSALKLVGECNVQFAYHPKSDAFRLIELNPRLSRSSALASKATGYPIAYVAAQLALGGLLPDIVNPLTGVTSCFFEPALDYVVVKAPRWQFDKFPGADRHLGPEMKSIGENMGIGEDFASAFAKAWALTQTQKLPHGANGSNWSMTALRQELACPTDLRMSALFAALEQGLPLAEIEALTGFSGWFLQAFRDLAPRLKTGHLGFWGFRQIDTLAGEFQAQTAYLYRGQALEFTFGPGPWVLILGSGPYGIGCSVEFDYCCVSAIYALQAAGYKVAMMNSNPETLSTDCDLADALIFEPLLPESLNAVMAALRPVGVLASLGGQTPQNLLQVLPRHWPFWGTPVGQILKAENRLAFALALDQLQIPQAPWAKVTSLADALAFGQKVGYPLIYRPGFVLGGGGMQVIENAQALEKWGDHLQLNGPLPRTEGALLNRFLAEAKEFELDGIARLGQLEYYLFSENLEPSGIHSGDSHHVFPAQSLSPEVRAQALTYALKLAQSFELHGLFNLQFFYHQGAVLLIEANLRASRNLPFLSHVSGQNLVSLAIERLLASAPLAEAPVEISADQVGIRVPTFSWERMVGAKRELGVEMKATGEFCLLADSFDNVLQLCYNLPDFCAFTPSWRLSKGE